MAFQLIDMERWARREHFAHFMQETVCSYSMTVNLDITGLKGRLYPAMLWLLTDTVHEFSEFRTAVTEGGLGVYDAMTPAYTIFHQETHTFSCLWTEFSEDYSTFLKRYEDDLARYGTNAHYIAQAWPASQFLRCIRAALGYVYRLSFEHRRRWKISAPDLYHRAEI